MRMAPTHALRAHDARTTILRPKSSRNGRGMARWAYPREAWGRGPGRPLISQARRRHVRGRRRCRIGGGRWGRHGRRCSRGRAGRAGGARRPPKQSDKRLATTLLSPFDNGDYRGEAARMWVRAWRCGKNHIIHRPTLFPLDNPAEGEVGSSDGGQGVASGGGGDARTLPASFGGRTSTRRCVM